MESINWGFTFGISFKKTSTSNMNLLHLVFKKKIVLNIPHYGRWFIRFDKVCHIVIRHKDNGWLHNSHCAIEIIDGDCFFEISRIASQLGYAQ